MVLGAATTALAQDTAVFFKEKCFSCHTIGGGALVGPDLKNVTERKDRDWLARFIINPQSFIDRGDPYALQMQEAARGVVMSTVPGITRAQADSLLDLIEAESALEKSQFVGMQLPARDLTEEDVREGTRLFTGEQPLINGGPACISCHTVRGLGWLGGGRLGPDLTKVYETIGGRNPLSAWLFSPATTTMRSVFADHPIDSDEILPLVAYFEQEATQVAPDDMIARLNFFLIGLGGAALALAAFDSLWRRRFRGVRGPMVIDRNARTLS